MALKTLPVNAGDRSGLVKSTCVLENATAVSSRLDDAARPSYPRTASVPVFIAFHEMERSSQCRASSIRANHVPSATLQRSIRTRRACVSRSRRHELCAVDRKGRAVQLDFPCDIKVSERSPPTVTQHTARKEGHQKRVMQNTLLRIRATRLSCRTLSTAIPCRGPYG